MAVPINQTDQFEAEVPQALFPSGLPTISPNYMYAVTKDGQRFLVNASARQSSAAPLTVVMNWTATIEK